MELLVTICARGGSKGIPGKNVKILNGNPLMNYSILAARKFLEKHDGILTLSTDSVPFRDVAARLGLKTDYLRPAELATDAAGKIPTIHDVVLYEEKRLNTKFDYVLDLDITSPLRSQDDLEEAYAMIKNDPQALNLFSVSRPGRNPYFNQVEQKENGYFHVVKTPEKPILSRQTAPKVFDVNASFYFYRRSFFDGGFANAYTPYSLVYLMKHICFDLDETVDFEFMSYLLENNKLDFPFLT